ncbi:MAG: transpeptidase family protein [Bacteroidota bacterium]|nr:transpeptidase family protein [Bacteroidota bacterium]
MSRKKEFLSRVYIITGIFLLVALTLIGKAFKISILEGDKWRKKAKELYIKLEAVEAERGKILADDGSPLAISLPFFEIRMDTKAKGLTNDNFSRHVDSLARCLNKHFMPDRPVLDIKNWLIKERKESNRYLLIHKSIDYQQLELLKTFPLFNFGQNKGGLIINRKNRREKPFKILANRTIGLHRENAQSIGMEESFNKYLQGKQGQRVMRKVGHNDYIPIEDVAELEAKKGYDVITTINVSIQEVAEEALGEAILNHQAKKGCAVVMEVATGQIKAIANLGLNAQGNLVEDYNYAVAHSTEPGSTLKTASTLAMLDFGKVNLKTAINITNGVTYFYDKKMVDSEPPVTNAVDLEISFEKSSNVGISKLAVASFNQHQEEFIKYYKRFNLHKKTGIEIGGEPSPIIKDPVSDKAKWYGTTLPWMSVGYELQLTPLQILTFYNGIANNGRIVKPYIVSSILDNERVVKSYSTKILADSIASHEAIAQIQELLKGVVEKGTAQILKNDMFTIAGKTGTAVTNYFETNGEHKEYQASFCGYFPVQNPKYSCIVVIYNPTAGGYYGAQAAAPVFDKIAKHCMRQQGIAGEILNEQAKPVLAQESLPVNNFGHAEDFRNIFKHIGLPFKHKQNGNWIRTFSDDEGVYTVSVEQTKNSVPDVNGMGLRDALFLLDKAGVKTMVHGMGKVRSQSIPAGLFAKGMTIELYLD